MKRVALLIGLAICAIVVSIASAGLKGPSQPIVRPGAPLIETTPGGYVVAPKVAPATTTAAVRAELAGVKRSTGGEPIVHSGEVVIESAPGVYISAPAASAR